MYLRYVVGVLILILLVFTVIKLWSYIFEQEKNENVDTKLNHMGEINKLAKKVKKFNKNNKSNKSNKQLIDNFKKGK